MLLISLALPYLRLESMTVTRRATPTSKHTCLTNSTQECYHEKIVKATSLRGLRIQISIARWRFRKGSIKEIRQW